MTTKEHVYTPHKLWNNAFEEIKSNNPTIYWSCARGGKTQLVIKAANFWLEQDKKVCVIVENRYNEEEIKSSVHTGNIFTFLQKYTDRIIGGFDKIIVDNTPNFDKELSNNIRQQVDLYTYTGLPKTIPAQYKLIGPVRGTELFKEKIDSFEYMYSGYSFETQMCQPSKNNPSIKNQMFIRWNK